MWELKQLPVLFGFLLNKLTLKVVRHSSLMGQWFVLHFGKALPQYKADSFKFFIATMSRLGTRIKHKIFLGTDL